MNADNVMGLAAQMSYYFALALFPFLIFLAAIVGSLPFTDLWEEILKWMTIYLPQGARATAGRSGSHRGSPGQV